MNTAIVNPPISENPAYEPPMVTCEVVLEVRAGSPLSMPDWFLLE